MEERVGQGKSAFVVTDRRGEKKAPREDVPVMSEGLHEVEVEKDKSSWKDVSYTLAMMQIPNGPVITILRGCGKRSDDRCFIADWVLPPFWSDKVDMDDWKKTTRIRLDTFLNCECIEGGRVCEKHRHRLEQWKIQDSERYDRVAKEAMPESLEGYLRAEMSRQQGRIVAPGR